MTKTRLYNRDIMLAYLNATTNYTVVEDATNINDNCVAYNNTLKSLRVKDASNQTKIVLEIPLGRLNAGDKVNVKLETMNVSGDAIGVAIDYYTKSDYSDINYTNFTTLSTEKTTFFSTFENSFIVRDERFVRVAIGNFAAGVGDNYIRNVEIEVESANQNYLINPYQSLINFDSRVGTITHTNDCHYYLLGDVCKFFFNFEVTAYNITQGFATFIRLPFKSVKPYVTGLAYVFDTADGINVMEPLTLSANSNSAYLKTPNVLSSKFKVGTRLYGQIEYQIAPQ